MDWLSIFRDLGFVGIVSLAIAWIIRSLFTHWLSSDMERHKASLATQHAKEIEQLRSDLRTQAFEHETRFAKAHDRRAKVIAELYRLLYHAKVDFKSLTAIIEFAGEDPKDVKRQRAIDSFNGFSTFFHENRLYLEEGICEDVEKIVDKLKDVYGLWQAEMRSQQSTNAKRERDYWHEADQVMDHYVPPIFSKIESSFRHILGIDGTALE